MRFVKYFAVGAFINQTVSMFLIGLERPWLWVIGVFAFQMGIGGLVSWLTGLIAPSTRLTSNPAAVLMPMGGQMHAGGVGTTHANGSHPATGHNVGGIR